MVPLVPRMGEGSRTAPHLRGAHQRLPGRPGGRQGRVPGTALSARGEALG